MADIDITITISSDNVAEFKTGFLACKPKEGDDARLSDLEYFKVMLDRYLTNVYETGKIMIAKQAIEPEIVNDIIIIS